MLSLSMCSSMEQASAVFEEPCSWDGTPAALLPADSLTEADRSLADHTLADRNLEAPVHSQASRAQSPAAAAHKGAAGLEVESQAEVVLQPGRAGSTDTAAGAAAGAAAAVVAQASPAEADGTGAQPCPPMELLVDDRVVVEFDTGPAVSVTGCTGRCYLQSQAQLSLQFEGDRVTGVLSVTCTQLLLRQTLCGMQ